MIGWVLIQKKKTQTNHDIKIRLVLLTTLRQLMVFKVVKTKYV